MKDICIVTASRAEYGLLKPLMTQIDKQDDLKLHIVVTGAHLSPEFGFTYKDIESDGFVISAKIEMLLSSDTNIGITKSIAVALMGFADYFAQHRPDIVIVLGDRYECLAVAIAAMIAKIPLAHIHGGEITRGAYDDAIRHSITKMSHLHFVSTEKYRRRVIQLGESPQYVFNVGALGVENIKYLSLWSKEKLEDNLKFKFGNKLVMVTYHPVTLDNMPSEAQFQNLLDVLDRHRDVQVIFTKANADTGGRIINTMIDRYVEENADRTFAFDSLGQIRYLSVLRFCRAVVGNSSSGVIEAPSFHIATVDIGDRQQGRVMPESVIHCGYQIDEIDNAFQKAISDNFRDAIKYFENPYEGENTSNLIINKIKEALDIGIEIKKTFNDMFIVDREEK